MANQLGEKVTDSYLFRTNPIIRKLSRVEETDAEVSCTYKGIGTKLLYFMAMVIIGIILEVLLKSGLGGQVIESEGMKMTTGEVVVLAITAILLIVSPILAMIIKATIPVTGALFCLSTGYVITWAGTTFGQEYSSSIILAILLTTIIVSVLALLYFTGKVHVTQKFRTVVTTLLISTFCGSLLVLIMALIPSTRAFVTSLKANWLINIGGSVLYTVIAALFLLVDFDTIRRTVEDGLPKKYEWWASFGLAFSVIWLFFRILELISKVKGSKSGK